MDLLQLDVQLAILRMRSKHAHVERHCVNVLDVNANVPHPIANFGVDFD